MGAPLAELRGYLELLAVGKIENREKLEELFSACWDQLEGSGVEGMTAEKLSRLENPNWNPPELSFDIERHGSTVMGSTRAELHRWTIDVYKATADCNPSHSYRQLYKKDRPLRVGPLVDEIVMLIISGKDDQRLQWFPDRSKVRILVRDFIVGRYQQTEEGRQKRFRTALEKKLKAEGWEKVTMKRDVYRCTTQPSMG